VDIARTGEEHGCGKLLRKASNCSYEDTDNTAKTRQCALDLPLFTKSYLNSEVAANISDQIRSFTMFFPRNIVLPLGYYIVRGLSQGLPTVDLGYEIHQANSFNVRRSRFVNENVLTVLGDWSILQLFRYQICTSSHRRPPLDTTSTSTAKPNICPDRWRRELLPSSICSLVSLWQSSTKWRDPGPKRLQFLLAPSSQLP